MAIASGIFAFEGFSGPSRELTRQIARVGYDITVQSLMPCEDRWDVLAGVAGLASRAVAIASQLDHPVYDALYLALAEREQTTLITADARLIAKIRGTAWQSRATSLANYMAPT